MVRVQKQQDGQPQHPLTSPQTSSPLLLSSHLLFSPLMYFAPLSSPLSSYLLSAPLLSVLHLKSPSFLPSLSSSPISSPFLPSTVAVNGRPCQNCFLIQQQLPQPENVSRSLALSLLLSSLPLFNPLFLRTKTPCQNWVLIQSFCLPPSMSVFLSHSLSFSLSCVPSLPATSGSQPPSFIYVV